MSRSLSILSPLQRTVPKSNATSHSAIITKRYGQWGPRGWVPLTRSASSRQFIKINKTKRKQPRSHIKAHILAMRAGIDIPTAKEILLINAYQPQLDMRKLIQVSRVNPLAIKAMALQAKQEMF